MSAPATFHVTVAGTRVRVRTVGSGDPLLLIMGIGGNLDMWTPLTRHLPGRQLIAFDFPGTGSSGPARFPPLMAANALFTRALLHQLGHRHADVLGYSWGGLLAQQLAIQHPCMVDRLVLVATSFGLGARPPALKVIGRMMTPRRYYSREYFVRIAPEFYGGRFRTEPALLNAEANRRIGHPPSYAGYLAQLAAVAGYSTLPSLPLIKSPVLLLAGDDDPIAPVANQKILGRLIRNAETYIIPGAGHLLLTDSPELAAPKIRTFLDEA